MDLAQVAELRREENGLVVNALAGDKSSFDELYRRHSRRIYQICLRMVDDPTIAEDLTQEAFVLAYRKLATFRQESRFSTWLHAIAVNTVLMFFRKRKASIHECSLESPAYAGDESTNSEREVYGRADEVLRMAVDRVALQRAIADLPEGYRMMVILHDIQGYQHEEIAQMLGCTIGNTKSQLHKARLKLRETLLQRSGKKRRRRSPKLPEQTGWAAAA
jgi:RNA polymerase sigma-70 factor (ECF subfamily)